MSNLVPPHGADSLKPLLLPLAERAGKPWTWVRCGMIWYLIRPPCVADFPQLGDPSSTGPHGLPGVLFRCAGTG
jgi:hypothetical protein